MFCTVQRVQVLWSKLGLNEEKEFPRFIVSYFTVSTSVLLLTAQYKTLKCTKMTRLYNSFSLFNKLQFNYMYFYDLDC